MKTIWNNPFIVLFLSPISLQSSSYFHPAVTVVHAFTGIQNQQRLLQLHSHFSFSSTKVRSFTSTKTLQMPRGIKKENLPTKVCVSCQRPFTWRKKWEKVWDEVTTCSKSCNNKRRLAMKASSKRQVEGTEASATDRIESTTTTTLQESLDNQQEEEENVNLNELLESVDDIKLDDHPSSDSEATEEEDLLDPEARRIAERKARKDAKKKKKAERRAQREGKIEHA